MEEDPYLINKEVQGLMKNTNSSFTDEIENERANTAHLDTGALPDVRNKQN